MANEFDRKWLALIAPLTWVEAFYALIGLTRLGEHPTTVERLAAALQRPEDEAIKLAWKASRVRPDESGRTWSPRWRSSRSRCATGSVPGMQ